MEACRKHVKKLVFPQELTPVKLIDFEVEDLMSISTCNFASKHCKKNVFFRKKHESTMSLSD